MTNLCKSCVFDEESNEYEILIRQLKREISDLMKTTEAKFLIQDGKIAEMCVFIKENLSNSIRILLDDMLVRGDIDRIISETILSGMNTQTTPQMYGAVGDGRHDDTGAIVKALETSNTIVFPEGTYLVSLPFVFDVFTTLIGSGEDKTKIIYRPYQDGNFMTATHKDGLKLKDIAIVCEETNKNVNGVVIARNGVDKPAWGGRIQAENVIIQGFNQTQLKIYAPFCTYVNNLSVIGTGFKRNAANNKLCDGDSIGIELIGYEAGKIDTFGNCTKFENSFIQQCKYGLKITSCTGIEFNNVVFEPNFINVYAPHTHGVNGVYTNLRMVGCWMEDYTKQSHPNYGAYSIYDIDETTGLIPEPRPDRGSRIHLVNCSIHSTCKQDYSMGVYANYLGGTNATFNELKQHNKPLVQFNSVDGSLIDINANQSFFYGQLASRQGLKLYDCRNDYNNLGEDLKLYSYQVENPNDNKTDAFEWQLPNRYTYTEPTETVVDVYMWCTGGFTCWYRVVLGGKNVIEKKVMNDDGVFARDIDENNKGLKVTVTDNGYVTLTMKAVTCEYARIDLKVRKLMR